LRLLSVDDILGIVLLICTPKFTTCKTALIHLRERLKKPANRLKLRPQYIDFSCLDPI